MINCKHTNPYKFKLRANIFNYITVSGPYTTTHDVKVPFSIPEFYSSKIITHQFHIDNTLGDKRIGYDMIVGHDLMLQLGLKSDFRH